MAQHTLEKRLLGTTGLSVSQIGLGTVKFGRNQGVKYPQGFDLPDDAFLSDFLALARDLGINLLDTAPAYGESESRLGRLLKGQRHDWIIASKAGEEFEDGLSRHDFSPAHFESSLARSLKRLNTDTLDILLIHSNGNDVEILENDALIRTLEGFKTRGLVRAVGASSKTPEGGLKALECLDVVMATYTPDYTDERPVLDEALRQNKGIILKKVLSSGHTQDPAQAIRFGLSHPAVHSLILGTINPEHLRTNCAF